MFVLLKSSETTDDDVRNRSIIMIVAAFVVLAVSTLLYLRELDSLIARRTSIELSRTSNIITTAFRSRILDQMENLRALSMFIAQHETINEQKILDTLHLYSIAKDNVRLMVTTPSGISYTDEGDISSSTDREYYARGIRGRGGLSGPYANKNGEAVVVVSIPILREDEILGVLSLAEPVSAYESFLREVADNPKIRSSIISPDGSILATTAAGGSGNNLYADLEAKGIVQHDELYQILLALKAGRNRLIRDTSTGEEQFIFLNVALDDIYIVSSIPASYEAANLGDVLERTALLILALFIFFLGLIIYMLRFRSSMMRRMSIINQELQSVIANTPGGAIQTRFDEERTLCFMSEGFLKLCGCDREQIQKDFDNKYLRMLHPEDLINILKSLDEQLEKEDYFELEYRLRHQSKDWIWILQKGRRVVTPDETFLYSTIVDISQSKELAERSLINAEAFHQLLDISGNSLFDFEPVSGVITFSARFTERYGWPARLERFPQSALDGQLVHEDDIDTFLKFIDTLYDGESAAGAEFRLLNRDGGYAWCSVAATVVFDASNAAVKIVGKIEDIDQQKRSIVALEEKSLRDPFTGLYNKTSSADLIGQRLLHVVPGTIGALFIIDSDNFKSVNDTLGHLTGDQAIKDLAGELSRIFRSSDIVGRIGGDEFIVYMHNAANADLCKAKAEAVCEAFRKTYGSGERIVRVSASVGLALYPANGTDYNTLYQRADEAMYQAKKQGKNRFRFAGD